MASRPAAEPRIRLLTIFMLTSKLLCREGSGRWAIAPKVRSLNPLKPALSFRAFGHSRMTRGTKANHLTGRPRDAPLRRNTTLPNRLAQATKELHRSSFDCLFSGTCCTNNTQHYQLSEPKPLI